MKTGHFGLINLTLMALFLRPAIAENGTQIVYSEPLHVVEIEYVGSAGDATAEADRVRSIKIDVFGQRLNMRLHSNRALLSANGSKTFGSDIGIYRGEIDGVADSWVRLVIADGAPRGMFWDGQEMYGIDVSADNGSSTIYRLKDLHIEAGMLSCSHLAPATSAQGLLQAVADEISTAAANGPGAFSQIDMAIISDAVFTASSGGNAEADLIARINNVDGLFSAQLGVQLNVNRIDTFSAIDDPFTGETDASLLIEELSEYRDANPEQSSNGLTHLFTGRDLDGTTAGIAYSGAICSRRFGAGLTQGTFGLAMDSLVAAHEIGHNFGAPHDGTEGSVCESEEQTFLMAPTINNNDQFSACSISEMQAEIADASCITPLPITEIAVVAGAQPSTALLGNPATITFNANSLGTDATDDVNVDISVPAEVSLDSVSATDGSCTSGAGSASCSIGSIPAGSGVTVTLDVTTVATGSGTFDASISASSDANDSNNQASVSLTIDPAIELVVTPAATIQITLDQSRTIQPRIENQATLAATNVVVTFTPDTGLQIDTASWAQGSCDIDAGVATCQAATLAAQSSNNVDLRITGTVEGALSYAISASADEVDRDPANNDSSGQVTVGPVVVQQESSGGGAFSLWLIGLLLLVRSIRRTST